MTPIVVSWSGGKDAAWTLHTLPRLGYRPVALITTVTEPYERVAMHGIRCDVLRAQARATGLPLFEARQPAACDNATYERVFGTTLATIRQRMPEVQEIAFGDLFLADIRAWRDALCARHDWRTCYPLFGRDTEALADEMLAGGLGARLCCVDTEQLDASFSGRAFDRALLAELPAAVDRCGERGEFHTCVHAGPMFAQPLSLERGDTVLRDRRFAFTDFELGD